MQAWALLVERRVIRVRPEAAFELPDLHPPETEPLVAAFPRARDRGVDVRITTTPGFGNPGFNAVQAWVAAHASGAAPGLVYRPRPGQQLHTKHCVVDGRSATVGSTTWTKAGFDVNAEVMVRVDDEGLAAELLRVFDEDWALDGGL